METRYTVNALRREVVIINQNLEEIGATVRFEVSRRNGYQAADEYSVNSDGNRVGSGVNRLIGTGKSREVADVCWRAYYIICNKSQRDRIEILEQENASLKAKNQDFLDRMAHDPPHLWK